MTVRWSPLARNSFQEIVKYLHDNWTLREVERFVHRVESVVVRIQKDPYLFQASYKKTSIRRAIISKQITLFYRISKSKKESVLLLFWDNRRNPSKLKY